MFGHRFFGARYFGPRYFGPAGGSVPSVAVGPAFFASTSRAAQPDGSAGADPVRSTSEPA